MVRGRPDDRSAKLLNAFNTAVGLHVAGQFGKAEPLYRDLLRQLPNHPDILDYYGTLRHQIGDHAGALGLIERSVALRPMSASTRNRLGSVLKALGRRPVALDAFRRASVTSPGLVEPVTNLAVMLHEDAGAEPALGWSRRACVLQPDSFDATLRRGIVLKALGRYAEALPDLSGARRRQPADPEVRLHLAAVLQGLGDYERSLASLRIGIAANPGAHELYANLIGAGGPLIEDGAFVAWARRMVTLRPLEARLWSNLATEAYRAAQPERALRAARRAMILDPVLEPAIQAVAAASFHCNLLAAARIACRRGLAVYPGNPELGYALAEVEFIDGSLQRAWELYECRIARRLFRPRLALPPVWQGPGTEAGPLLIASEQGVGDEVIFLSCVPDLLERIREPLVIEVDARIVPAIGRSFPEAVVVPRQLVPGDALGQYFDYSALIESHGVRHAVLAGSLPRFFRTDRDRPAHRSGYLRAAPDRVEHWRGVLARYRPNRTVGVVWRSALMNRYRARFHAGILDWAPVFRTPGCTFVNLMHGDVGPELERLREAEGVAVERLPGIDLWNDLDDLLALLAALDFVVAARTANCAFAAAVGTPTIRVAQSFNRITDGRDFFFPNVRPTLSKWQSFDAGAAAEGAAQVLREWVGAP